MIKMKDRWTQWVQSLNCHD